jgi:hypothetical protein
MDIRDEINISQNGDKETINATSNNDENTWIIYMTIGIVIIIIIICGLIWIFTSEDPLSILLEMNKLETQIAPKI